MSDKLFGNNPFIIQCECLKIKWPSNANGFTGFTLFVHHHVIPVNVSDLHRSVSHVYTILVLYFICKSI